jgi:hypothetical protein
MGGTIKKEYIASIAIYGIDSMESIPYLAMYVGNSQYSPLWRGRRKLCH